MFRYVCQAAVTLAVILALPSVAQNAKQSGGVSKSVCMASEGLSAWTPHESSKAKRLLKGIGQEFSHSFNEMGKDLVFIFSTQDIDPYDKSAPDPKKPYLLAEAELVDGTTAKVYHYPDGSFSISGGFVDGSYICPNGDGTMTISYPNGVTGKVRRIAGGGCEILRPDNSITTITRTRENRYRIENDKIGYMGDMHKDVDGEIFNWKSQISSK